jgi:predicted transcriptional regulator
MDLPIEVIKAVKEEKQLSLPLPKKRAPYVKKLTKRILHAVGNGLRTSTSIANALNVDKAKIQSNLWHMKAKGLVYASKQNGSNEHKYHLTTDKPVLDQLDLTIKKKRKPYKARAPKAVKVVTPVTIAVNEMQAEITSLQKQLDEKSGRLNAIQTELIHAQAENFDLKAVIKYLERKAN